MAFLLFQSKTILRKSKDVLQADFEPVCVFVCRRSWCPTQSWCRATGNRSTTPSTSSTCSFSGTCTTGGVERYSFLPTHDYFNLLQQVACITVIETTHLCCPWSGLTGCPFKKDIILALLLPLMLRGLMSKGANVKHCTVYFITCKCIKRWKTRM